ncbi:hypothetical protein ACHWQZ_G014024 [Mnemiopsis leidyi]
MPHISTSQNNTTPPQKAKNLEVSRLGPRAVTGGMMWDCQDNCCLHSATPTPDDVFYQHADPLDPLDRCHFQDSCVPKTTPE